MEKPKSSSKRTECDVNSFHDIQNRRERGEINCAECQRRKLKCDRKIPCNNCHCRTRSKLCPNGTMSTSPGTRFVLAVTEPLQRRVYHLRNRILQLEEVLFNMHSVRSSEPHPLLCNTSWMEKGDEIGFADQTRGNTIGVDKNLVRPDCGASEVTEEFGILSISNHGVSRFFGATGQIESLLLVGHSAEYLHSPEKSTINNSGNQLLFSRRFPFISNGQTTDTLVAYLPSYDVAQALCGTYFERVGWLLFTLTKRQLFDEILPSVYLLHNNAQSMLSAVECYSDPHEIALLFITLAIGSLLQFDLPTAEDFYQLSISALMLRPVLERPSLSTIQTLYLMSIYKGMSGSKPGDDVNLELIWSLRMLATMLSHGMGLHRDCSNWEMTQNTIDRRQSLFWDLFRADVRESLTYGRPPFLSETYIDCPYPRISDNRSRCENVLCRFAVEIGSYFISHTVAGMPNYETVIVIDQKIRDFSFSYVDIDKTTADFLDSVVNSGKSIIQMYLHRAFFMRAIKEEPQEPLRSQYVASFLASYRGALHILSDSYEKFNLFPKLWSRIWLQWKFVFCSSVVYGTIAAKAPRCSLAVSAMEELEKAYDLFRRGSEYSSHAMKALPIVYRLREKGRYALALEQFFPGIDRVGWRNGSGNEVEDEFTFLSGGSRLLNASLVAYQHYSIHFNNYPLLEDWMLEQSRLEACDPYALIISANSDSINSV